MTVTGVTPGYQAITDTYTLAVDANLGANSNPPVEDGTPNQVGAACVPVGDACPTDPALGLLGTGYTAGSSYTFTLGTLIDGVTGFEPNTAYDCYALVANGCNTTEVLCSEPPTEAATLFAEPTAIVSGSSNPNELTVTLTPDANNGNANTIVYEVGCAASPVADCATAITLWADYDPATAPVTLSGVPAGDYQCCGRSTAVNDGVSQVVYTGPSGVTTVAPPTLTAPSVIAVGSTEAADVTLTAGTGGDGTEIYQVTCATATIADCSTLAAGAWFSTTSGATTSVAPLAPGTYNCCGRALYNGVNIYSAPSGPVTVAASPP